MKKVLLLFLILTGTASAATLADLITNARMLIQDRGAPKAFVDSLYYYNAANALQYVGSTSMCVVVDTTITLTAGTVQYALTRFPLKMVTAFAVSQSGAISSVPRMPHDDIWKTDHERDFGYSIGPSATLFITKRLTYEYTLKLHYVTTPKALARDSSTAIDLPAGLLPALYYMTAASVLDATRIPVNVNSATKLEAQADRLIGVYMVASRGERLDSLAILK
jgi:hypothetical protein